MAGRRFAHEFYRFKLIGALAVALFDHGPESPVDAATFIDYYDAFQNPYGNFTYRIGPSASDTATPVKVLGAHACELRSAWAVGKSIYATIEITDSEQWLFELPADVVP